PPTALVEDLMNRRGRRFRRGPIRGALTFAGFIQVGERRYAWVRETAAPELLDADAASLSRILGAVASVARIALLRELFGRDRSSTELGAALGDVSPGHTYHHLKELQAAGILVQVSRGLYRIAPPALIPVAIILAAAADIAGLRPGAEVEPFPVHPQAESV
ncbi:MAG: helix-turn-helix transcriptional regulator, partial [Gemmatimonadales bacterium]|nr:helix-turn-helix transcriptional regulator [Gemmatimonadales bacterium]